MWGFYSSLGGCCPSGSPTSWAFQWGESFSLPSILAGGSASLDPVSFSIAWLSSSVSVFFAKFFPGAQPATCVAFSL